MERRWWAIRWEGPLDTAKQSEFLHKRVNCEELQKDLRIPSDWAIKWQIKFSAGKCKVMHVEKNNPITAGLLSLLRTEVLRTWYIFSQNCALNMQSKKANQMVGILRKMNREQNKSIITPLYKLMVHPYFEIYVQFCLSHLKNNTI